MIHTGMEFRCVGIRSRRVIKETVGGDAFENQDAHFIFHANTACESASCPKYRRRPAAALKWGEDRKRRAERPQIDHLRAELALHL
jgi:hypothetical protein